MAFSEQFLDELTARNDIEDVVGQYVRLTKKSGSNLFGLCPFHNEKTPSFSVSKDKQIYHCFGCGKGGGVISFIMGVENLSFRDAVAFLAKRVNMPMPEEENTEETSRRKILLQLNKDAAKFYYEMLVSDRGRPGQDYMKQRGIGRKTAMNFGLGYAPDSWDALTLAMKAKGYTNRDLMEAGLVKGGKTGGVYDAFRNRLMFPVIDVRGSVIAFSGRTLGDDKAKYINSPDTQIYTKGSNIFAINLAKNSKSDYFILVEGNVDVVSLHQAGFDSAVASLGTALTASQAKLLAQYKNEIVICYDSDTAGRNAAQKAINIFSKLDLKVRVLQLTDAKDPDEYIKKFGAEAFRKVLEGSAGQVDYRLQLIEKESPPDSTESRADYLKKAEALLVTISNQAEREVYADAVAKKAGVSKDSVLADVKNLWKKKVRNQKKRDGNEGTRPAQLAQPKQKEFRYDNPRSAKAEEGIIRLLYLDPALAKKRTLPAPEKFSSPVLARFYSELLHRIESGLSFSMAVLEGLFSPEEMSHFIAVTEKAEDISNSVQAFDDYEKILTEPDDVQEDWQQLIERKKENDKYGGFNP